MPLYFTVKGGQLSSRLRHPPAIRKLPPQIQNGIAQSLLPCLLSLPKWANSKNLYTFALFFRTCQFQTIYWNFHNGFPAWIRYASNENITKHSHVVFISSIFENNLHNLRSIMIIYQKMEKALKALNKLLRMIWRKMGILSYIINLR